MTENKFQMTEFANGGAEVGNVFFNRQGFRLTVVPVDDSEENREFHEQGFIPCRNGKGIVQWFLPSELS